MLMNLPWWKGCQQQVYTDVFAKAQTQEIDEK